MASLSRPTMGSSMLGSSINPGTAGVDTSQLSIAEQLMQLDQAITLTLQDIDANLSAAHQTVNNKILPAVKRYGVASARTWQGAKFWMKFFEAAADVNLSGHTPGYGVGPEEDDEGATEEGGEYYDDDDDDDLKTIDATMTDRAQDETRDVTASSISDDGDEDILEEQQHHNLQRYSLMGTTSAAATASSRAKGKGPSLPSPSPSPLPPAPSHDDTMDADDSDDLDDSVDITRLRPVATSRYVSTPSTDASVGPPPSITQARSIEDDTFFGIRPPASSKSASGGRSVSNSASSGATGRDYGRSGSIQNPFAKPPSGGPKAAGATRAGQPAYKPVENTVHGGRSLIGTDRSDTFSPPSPSPFGPGSGSSS